MPAPTSSETSQTLNERTHGLLWAEEAGKTTVRKAKAGGLKGPLSDSWSSLTLMLQDGGRENPQAELSEPERTFGWEPSDSGFWLQGSRPGNLVLALFFAIFFASSMEAQVL